ncbi:MAG TPA: CDP-alcohol phosphatidyltransferase family protein [Opitutaceae bacterium]|nr:CDP-alcohol phosphatidyltransferase family protein [Opitutaceae bacterium]
MKNRDNLLHPAAEARRPDAAGVVADKPRNLRRQLNTLPNFLSLLRLACAPLLVIAVVATGSRPWFWSLFGGMLLTDALDGFLARRLHAVSDLGRRLDSYGDYATVGATVAGVWLLWPAVMLQEWRWIAGAFIACFAVTVYGLVRWRIVLGYHTLLAKFLGFLLPATLTVMLLGWSVIPFHFAVILQVMAAAEEFTIALLLPGYSGAVRTVRQAWQMRQTLGSHSPNQPERPARPPE